MMEVEKATAGRMIDRLVANGWVESRTQADDRRVKRVYLTREAERVHKRIWRVAEDTVNAALADISSQESTQLMSLLQRIKKTLVSADDGEGSALSAPARKRAHIANGRQNGRAAPRIPSRIAS
jgi:DNA-binding PadR family transcriptional regulator